MTGNPRIAGPLLDRAGNAVGAEDGDATRGNFVDLVYKMRAFCAQPLDDVAVMDDFMANVNGRAIFFECALDDLDRPFDPGAEPSRLS